jgi:hypothetical protein
MTKPVRSAWFSGSTCWIFRPVSASTLGVALSNRVTLVGETGARAR